MSDASLLRELQAQWASLVPDAAGRAVFDELCRRHREPHRRYHSLVHVAHVLREVRRLLPYVADADAVAVQLAAWFHDAVYEARAAPGDNERASALLADARLRALGLASATTDEVARLVRVTAGHQPDRGDTSAAVLVDADLAVLASDPATYQAYVNGVRAEYAHVTDDAWRTGRGQFLRGLLARAQLFLVPAGDDREQRARANLTAELASLDAPPPASVVHRD